MPNSPSLVVTDAATMFHMALDNAGIPINGVGMPDPIGPFPPEWHMVMRPDGMAVHISYSDEATPDQIVQGDDIVMNLDVSPIQVRSIWAIYTDLTTLSNKQKDNIKDDLNANNDAKIGSIGPPHDGIMLVLDWAVTAGTLIQTRDAYCRIAAVYAQQNVHYLEQPAFDKTINISGWEVIPVVRR